MFRVGGIGLIVWKNVCLVKLFMEGNGCFFLILYFFVFFEFFDKLVLGLTLFFIWLLNFFFIMLLMVNCFVIFSVIDGRGGESENKGGGGGYGGERGIREGVR